MRRLPLALSLLAQTDTTLTTTIVHYEISIGKETVIWLVVGGVTLWLLIKLGREILR